MAKYPKPDGWKGGTVESSVLRTFDGHIGMNYETDPMIDRRNERSFDAADIGGENYAG